jgi:folate-binding protein YgfZ
MANFFVLKNPLIFSAAGKDSARYLNARLTNNIKALEVGKSCLAGMLSPQGRTEALFNILRQADSEFLLICDAGDPAAVLSALKRYIVADRVNIADRSSADKVVHIAPVLAVESSLTKIPASRSKEIGVDLVGSQAEVEKLISELKLKGYKELSDEDQLIARLRAKILSFPEELNEKVNFAEGVMDHAISFIKGCYVGQEVIEKVNAFGKVPRLFFFAAISGKFNFAGEYQLSIPGKVVTSVYDQGKDETICILSLPSSVTDSNLKVISAEKSGTLQIF